MIEWKGGLCPVEAGVMVCVLMRDGHIITSHAYDFCWEHDNNDSDVMSYRVSGPKRSDDILNQAIAETTDRGVTYDSPGGERSMSKTVRMFNIHTGLELTETQGWQFMEILKMVRSGQGKFKLDNFVDGSAYAALAGESASKC